MFHKTVLFSHHINHNNKKALAWFQMQGDIVL